MVTLFPLDPMHLLFLGFVRRLLVGYYFEGSAPFKLSQTIKIKRKVSKVHDYITSDFAKKSKFQRNQALESN